MKIVLIVLKSFLYGFRMNELCSFHLDLMSNIQNFTLPIQMLMQKDLIVNKIFYYIQIFVLSY
jgi:hypothetical protein